MEFTDTKTLTWGDVCENHFGMQKVGDLSIDGGFNRDDLLEIKKNFENIDFECELINLNKFLPKDKEGEDACVLIIRKGVNYFVNSDDLYKEHDKLDVDKKAYMRGRVVNKRARYNLCFADFNQNPDYENKKGRIIKFDDVKLTQKIRNELNEMLGEKATQLMLEGNYYYDLKKCGIGFHGDTERRKVVGMRLGCDMNLVFKWYINSKSLGERCELNLKHGDMYVMNEKASGFDWKKRSKLTLRHSAGCEKFTKDV